MMTKLKLVVVAVFILVLAGPCIAGGSSQTAVLYGIKVDTKRVLFEVKSTGCTRAKDFQVTLNKATEPATLRVIRMRPDRCRGMPKRVSLIKTLDFPSMDSNLEVVLLNPLKLIK